MSTIEPSAGHASAVTGQHLRSTSPEQTSLGNLDTSLLREIGSYLVDKNDATSIGRLADVNTHLNNAMRESITGGLLLNQAKSLHAQNTIGGRANALFEQHIETLPGYEGPSPKLKAICHAQLMEPLKEIARSEAQLQNLINQGSENSPIDVNLIQQSLAVINNIPYLQNTVTPTIEAQAKVLNRL
jgi:hypothetical protein